MAMVARAEAQKLLSNLQALGGRKLGALAMVGVVAIALVSLAAWTLSKPTMEVLYSGLDRQDVARIGSALTEAGIPFDVNAAGDTVSTNFSQTASARMLLAEKSLPRSDKAGYELFDTMGSMGLTTFMQEVTKVRALEGELARTIQTLKDVRAARVHIVLPEQGSFRREQQPPSASVVIRTDNVEDFANAQAIRHLVASAIPGMKVDQVTVLNTDGRLLASGDDSTNATSTKQLGMESIVSTSIEDSIRRTLAPYLGVGNFQSSVIARLDTDRKQTSARTFDPEGRVERSTRTVKETGQSNDTAGANPATAGQNVPQAQPQAAANGNTSTEAKDRREELTNYEINETTTQTVSDGYDVKKLSVAVVVNRARLAATLGENPTAEQIDAALAEVRRLVSSAAGISDTRGDQLEVTAVDFVSNGRDLEPVPAPSYGEMLLKQSGTVVNALTILVVAILVIWFGLKPAIRAIAGPGAASNDNNAAGSDEAIELHNPSLDVPEIMGIPGAMSFSEDLAASLGYGDPNSSDDLLDELTRNRANSPKVRLEKLVEFDEAQAAAILKQWIHEKEAA